MKNNLIKSLSYLNYLGQPLTLLGSTGPVLVFESIMNSFSKENQIDYMGFRVSVV